MNLHIDVCFDAVVAMTKFAGEVIKSTLGGVGIHQVKGLLCGDDRAIGRSPFVCVEEVGGLQTNGAMMEDANEVGKEQYACLENLPR